MSLKTIESVLDLQTSSTVRDLSVQFGCTGAVTLAQQILQRSKSYMYIKGHIWPPLKPINDSYFSSISDHWLFVKVWYLFNFYLCYSNINCLPK